MRAIAAALALLACEAPPLALRVVTFNTGTTKGLAHDAPPEDGYGSAEAERSDRHYGDGLAWAAAIDAAARYFARTQPDVVAFFELFHPRNCAEIPAEAHAGFVCEGWREGDPSVVERVLGPGYQIACHPGKDDKCVAVKTSRAKLRGCESALCLDALAGARVPDCGGGARVARAAVEIDDRVLTVVSVHGSSGIAPEDRACRVKQFEQIFVDLDGAPGASGALNLVLGDLNTDPGRLAGFDESAVRILDFVGPGRAFRFHTAVGDDAPPTYAGLFNIDHVMSDGLRGDCGSETVYEGTYFDHRPIACDLVEPQPGK